MRWQVVVTFHKKMASIKMPHQWADHLAAFPLKTDLRLMHQDNHLDRQRLKQYQVALDYYNDC